MSELVLIAAMSQGNVIGLDGQIPWRLNREDRERYRPDMRRFKKLTTGHPIISGGITYRSIGKPLPERTNIVVSMKMKQEENKGVIICRSIEEAVRNARRLDLVSYVIGGQQIYETTINLSDRLEITEIHRNFEGDAFFPEINEDIWKEVNREDSQDYSFVKYRRI